MKAGDLALLAGRGTTLVTCPRSNRHTGAGLPPIEQFYASGVRVAIGTDSLAERAGSERLRGAGGAASAGSHRCLQPMLLDSATRQGARALGFDADYGTIEPGKRGRLLAVAVPPRMRTMWKNIWCRESAPSRSGGSKALSAYFSHVQTSQHFTCRSSASAIPSSRCRSRWRARCWRRRRVRDAGRRSSGFWSRWWRRAARRWGSIGSLMRSSTR